MEEELLLDLPVGARLVVFSGLRLGVAATEATAQAVEEVSRAIGAWDGPGAVVIAGDLFDFGGPDRRRPAQGGPQCLAASLDAHPLLVTALRAFSCVPGRKAVVLPGSRDAWLKGSPSSVALLEQLAGVEVAGAVAAEMRTTAGTSRVRVEPAEPPTGAPVQYFMPRVAQRLAGVVPGLWQGSTSSWLAGIDDLDDPAALPRFVVSRLVYRQLGRRLWLLVLPFLAVVLALRLPVAPFRATKDVAGAIRASVAAVAVLELVVLLTIGLTFVRQVWSAFSWRPCEPKDLNEAGRARSRDLVDLGWAGLVSGCTGRPELSAQHLPAPGSPSQLGFYANPGCCSEVVSETAPRLGGLGLPSPFLAKRHLGWVEIDGGNELHARLMHKEQAVAGATLAERLLAGPPKRSCEPRSRELGGPQPLLLASFPRGEQWPPLPAPSATHRRARRAAAMVVGLAGFLSLVVALSAPLAHRLRALRQFVPLVVPQAAGVLAALAGVGLLVLARGIRRGQHRAYVVCQATLVATGALDLVRAASPAAAAVAFATAGYLWLNRASFKASSDLPPLRPLWRAIGTLAGIFGLSVLAGSLALEASSWYSATLHHKPGRITWGQAFLATVERMGGVRHVPLPDPLNDFFSPAMFAVTAAIVLVAISAVFRPVVNRSPHAGRELERAREIVRRYGAGTLDYFALRSDKQFFFSGSTVVAYAIYSGTCLVSPDPVGPTSEREMAWRAFHEFADANGWALAVLGAAEEWLPIYRATGMRDLYVGDEAVVEIGRFNLDGGRFKGLRQAVNRVARYGYTISFHDPAQAGPELASELGDVMTKSRRGGAERGFSMTLGRIFDPKDEGLLLAVVRAPGSGRAVAFCQYVPAPAIVGYSLDLMRRDDGRHPNGLIDFAVVETIRYLKERGYEALGLNFATMRAVLAGEAGEGLPKRVQAWLLRRMSGSMQIESLWRFNAKYDPKWQPRYAVYDSPEHALPAALAVARAESFWELPVIGRFLVPSTRQQARAASSPEGPAL
ncbi:MAG: bifunctional lysylphosphatidylglycerol flippase/synthetase MprF [Acidimicrobiales bacterium]